jgi:hypothetical protein
VDGPGARPRVLFAVALRVLLALLWTGRPCHTNGDEGSGAAITLLQR